MTLEFTENSYFNKMYIGLIKNPTIGPERF